MVKIAPSVIAADFARLGAQMSEAEASGADLIHFDVMDGRFVPNLSIGPMVLEAVRRSTQLRIDAHLMITEPERFIDVFAQSGADTIIFHAEATVYVHGAIQQIKRQGKRAGVALNPATPAEQLADILGDVDLVLVMTVNPGFGGQQFIDSMLPKIARVRAMIGQRPIELCVDGGVDQRTAPRALAAGADMLVAGTAVFRHPAGIKAAIDALRGAAAGQSK